MAKKDDKSITDTGASGLDSFLAKVAQTPLRATSGGGRLMFAMDATASREPSWDQASKIQGDMFQ
ncbi:MAG: VWA domain-containing protein, partial [Gammaproteobacteria bacterium]|nr:VWA domain-containing protein [Gammaproteobacteria bacterium]